MTKQEILKEIKRRVKNAYPTAQVWLYGSRARNEATNYSDWDIIVLVDKPVDYKTHRAIADPVYDLGMELGEVFSVFIYSQEEWSKLSFTPFYKEVEHDKIIL